MAALALGQFQFRGCSGFAVSSGTAEWKRQGCWRSDVPILLAFFLCRHSALYRRQFSTLSLSFSRRVFLPLSPFSPSPSCAVSLRTKLNERTGCEDLKWIRSKALVAVRSKLMCLWSEFNRPTGIRLKCHWFCCARLNCWIFLSNGS